MTKVVRLRRGTTLNHTSGSGFTGVEGEVTVDTTNDTLRVHDGMTKGGHELVGVAVTQRITNKDIVADVLTVSGVSTFTGLLDANGGVTIDNVRIGIADVNTIDTSTGNLILNSNSGTVVINDQLNVSGVSTFESTLSVGPNGTTITTTGIGSVGIGSTTPLTNLDVSGDLHVRNCVNLGESYIPNKDSKYKIYLPAEIGEREFTTAGTYTWIAPENVTSVDVVCVGGGGGGASGTNGASGAGGGGLAWKNNIPVVPGQSYTVVVGAGGTALNTTTPTTFSGAGGTSYFQSTSTVSAYGGGGAQANGSTAGVGGTYFGDGGGDGGWGGSRTSGVLASGGGGAGGYVGAGGSGSGVIATSATAGSGGAGGGGGCGLIGGGGGGVGLYGQGSNGAAGGDNQFGVATDGGGGSGGTSAGVYGGAGESADSANTATAGDSGAVRILWGTGRQFPTTNVNQSLPGHEFTVIDSIDDNVRIGIGTTSPSSSLHIISPSASIILEHPSTSLNAGGTTLGSLDFVSNDSSTSANGSRARIFADATATGAGRIRLQVKSGSSQTFTTPLILDQNEVTLNGIVCNVINDDDIAWGGSVVGNPAEGSIFESEAQRDIELSSLLSANESTTSVMYFEVIAIYIAGSSYARLHKTWHQHVFYTNSTSTYTIAGAQLISSYNSDATNFPAGAVNASKVLSVAGTDSLILRIQNRTSPASGSFVNYKYRVRVTTT